MMMKRIIFTLIFILSVSSIHAADITFIVEAIKAGKANLLKDNMNEEVDINIFSEVSIKKGSGKDAVAILDTFFLINKVTGFTVLHHADKNESGFFVGKLVTPEGVFRVNITYTIKNGKLLIRIIRIG